MELEPEKDLDITNWATSRPVFSWTSQQNPGFSIKSWQSPQGELESSRGKGSEGRIQNPILCLGSSTEPIHAYMK